MQPITKMTTRFLSPYNHEITYKSSSGTLFPKELNAVEIKYYIDNSTELELGQKICFEHLGDFECRLCQKMAKKLFSGFCYQCLTTKAQADRCMLNPHLCHYTKGTCREPKFGKDFCYKHHCVYISFTDKFKIGITRENQVPIRWADQGATCAMIIAKVSSRHQAGAIEHFLKTELSDKTHWSKMLKAGNLQPSYDDIMKTFLSAKELLKRSFETSKEFIVSSPKNIEFEDNIILCEEAKILFLSYPLKDIPEKIKSTHLEKESSISGTITGIKGQYLFLDNEKVMNVRRHEGFKVNLKILSN